MGQGWYTGPSHVTRWCPWRQVADGTLCLSQNWMGRMWSRPSWSTDEAAAIRPSIFWKADGRYIPWRKPRGAESRQLLHLHLVWLSAESAQVWGDCKQQKSWCVSEGSVASLETTSEPPWSVPQSPPQLVQTGCLTKPERRGRELF